MGSCASVQGVILGDRPERGRVFLFEGHDGTGDGALSWTVPGAEL